jgi:hypothetical protein
MLARGSHNMILFNSFNKFSIIISSIYYKKTNCLSLNRESIALPAIIFQRIDKILWVVNFFFNDNISLFNICFVRCGWRFFAILVLFHKKESVCQLRVLLNEHYKMRCNCFFSLIILFVFVCIW